MHRKLCFSLLFTLFFAAVFGQIQNIVTDDGITSDLHKQNIGRIIFMAKPLPIEEFRQTDFLSVFALTDSVDLNIRVFMARSLTNSLHMLAPDMTAAELLDNGNYQFTFFIDNKLIYKENLNRGAGTSERKNKMTVFRVPLVSTSNEDSWGRFLWNRFMVNGGADGLTEGTHELKIEIRPYLDKGGIISGDIIASGQLKLNIAYPEVSAQQTAVQVIQSGSDWALSSSQYDKEKIIQLNKKILQKRLKEITSIVVVKNGKLLLEEYFIGASRETLHDTRSVGKSFASAMMGIAIKEGFVNSEYQLLRDFYDLKRFSNYSVQKDSVKIKDLLMMASVFNGSDADNDSPGNEEKMYPTENWVKFTLDLPIDTSKRNGGQWDYFTAGVVLLGDILNRTVPGGLEKYASDKLFQPLGIKSFKWEYTPQHVANTAGGLRLRSLDLAKFGQLYKDKGRWNGKQILTAEWVKATLSPQIQISETDNAFYGYLFWNKTYTVGGKKYEAFYCSGNGGNKVFIFKDLPLTIVITSTAFGKPYAHLQVDKIMEEFILPAVVKE